ncbi:Aminoacylase 1, partial [Operophtera brumata]
MGSIFILVVCLLTVSLNQAEDCETDPAVHLLQEYVRINTTTHNDLTPAVDFWKRLAAEEDLPISVYSFTEGYPVVVIKWAGTDSSASSIMLNSHMDVVPAEEEAGTANNIVPSLVTLVFDIRLATTLSEPTFDAQLRQWLAEAGDNIDLTYIIKDQQSPATLVTEYNPYFVAIANAATQ